MPSISAFNGSVRCCCRTRRSCCMSSFIQSSFRWFGLTPTVVVELWGGGLAKINKFYTSRYLVLIFFWIIGWYSTQPINTRTKRCRKYVHSFLRFFFFFFFCPILAYFQRMTLSSSLPFVTHIRGHMERTPLPSPLPCLPSFWSRKKNVHN